MFFFLNISIFLFNCCRSIYYKFEIEPVIPALQQLKEGLDQIGLLESIRCYPLSYKSCFTASAKPSLESITDLCSAEYSVTGSNRKEKEINLYKYFMDMLEVASTQACADNFDELSVLSILIIQIVMC